MRTVNFHEAKARFSELLRRVSEGERSLFTDLGTSHLGENIFEVPPEQGHISVFVNYCFALHRPEMKDLATLFWQQIARIRPESYVADNDYLNFLSMNKTLFAGVRDAVKALDPD